MFWGCRAVLAIAVVGLGTACPADSDLGDSNSGSEPPGSTSGGDTRSTGLPDGPTSAASAQPTTPTESTDGPIDPDVACGRFDDSSSCPHEVDDGIYCDWVEITPVAIEDGACVLGEAVGVCVPVTGGSTAAGCVPTSGCEQNPFSIDLGSQLGAFWQCGGAPPVGSSPCTYVEPGVLEPAACGCICDGFDGGSSGESSDSTGFGTGSSTGR